MSSWFRRVEHFIHRETRSAWATTFFSGGLLPPIPRSHAQYQTLVHETEHFGKRAFIETVHASPYITGVVVTIMTYIPVVGWILGAAIAALSGEVARYAGQEEYRLEGHSMLQSRQYGRRLAVSNWIAAGAALVMSGLVQMAAPSSAAGAAGGAVDTAPAPSIGAFAGAQSGAEVDAEVGGNTGVGALAALNSAPSTPAATGSVSIAEQLTNWRGDPATIIPQGGPAGGWTGTPSTSLFSKIINLPVDGFNWVVGNPVTAGAGLAGLAGVVKGFLPARQQAQLQNAAFDLGALFGTGESGGGGGGGGAGPGGSDPGYGGDPGVIPDFQSTDYLPWAAVAAGVLVLVILILR